MLAEGDVDEAVRLADQVVKLDKNDRIARLVLGVHALKQKQYARRASRTSPNRCAARSPISPRRCWPPGQLRRRRRQGRGRAIDKLQGADWYALFKDLHAGLILDLAGNKKEAGKRFERA